MVSLCSCATILGRSRTNIKENYSSLYHVMARLAKQEQLDRCAKNILSRLYFDVFCCLYFCQICFMLCVQRGDACSCLLQSVSWNPGRHKGAKYLKTFFQICYFWCMHLCWFKLLYFCSTTVPQEPSLCSVWSTLELGHQGHSRRWIWTQGFLKFFRRQLALQLFDIT